MNSAARDFFVPPQGGKGENLITASAELEVGGLRAF